MESKKDIRNRVLKKRNAITDKNWKEQSHKIYERVAAHPFFLQADAIYSYVNYKSEAGTREILSHAWNIGKKVAVPRIEGDVMDFYYIDDFSDLQEGYQGILEPKRLRPAREENALVLMPGAVFDRICNRIGYGKGFYDRYLSQHPNVKTIALAFELQVLEAIPTDPHDKKPMMIITEENIYERNITN